MSKVSNLTVHRYKHWLVEHLKRVYEEAVAQSYPQSFKDFAQHFNGEGRIILMRGDDSKVYAHALLEQNWRAPHRWNIAAAVEREYQGQGVGRLVMQDALERAASEGIEYLDGWLWADNERALKLDLSLGFRVVGRINDAFRDGTRSRDMLLVEYKR